MGNVGKFFLGISVICVMFFLGVLPLGFVFKNAIEGFVISYCLMLILSWLVLLFVRENKLLPTILCLTAPVAIIFLLAKLHVPQIPVVEFPELIYAAIGLVSAAAGFITAYYVFEISNGISFSLPSLPKRKKIKTQPLDDDEIETPKKKNNHKKKRNKKKKNKESDEKEPIRMPTAMLELLSPKEQLEVGEQIKRGEVILIK